MNLRIVRDILLFMLFCIVHVLVLSHIRLLGHATPMLYVYFILLFPRNYPRWALLLWSFAMGLVLDSFANMPGVCAASLTFIGLIKPSVLEMFMQRESAEDLKPSLNSMGTINFLLYVSLLVVVNNALFFMLETFNFYNWINWLWNVLGCSALTIAIIMVLETVRRK